MVAYLKQDGNKLPNVIIEKTWIAIPVAADNSNTPINKETYLVNPRVAEYIDMLERKVKGKTYLPSV